MADAKFEDLARFGITEQTVVSDREAIVHNMLAEDFLAQVGMEVPLDPDDVFYEVADSYLAQFGVLGMKWGRRRPRGANGLVDKSAEGEIDKSKMAGNRSKSNSDSKTARSMSNDELSAAIRRLQLEQQYNQLTAKKKPVIRVEIEKMIGNALRQNAQAYLTQYTGAAIGASLKKAGVPNAQELADRARKAREEADKDKKD